jgi:uncharacterized protein
VSHSPNMSSIEHVRSTKANRFSVVLTALLFLVAAAAGCNRQSLQEAAAAGDKESLDALISNGVDVNSRDADSMTALHHAVLKGHVEVVKTLLEQGADPNAAASIMGITEPASPLYCAVVIGRNDIAKILIENGAKVSAGALNPLDAAVLEGHTEIAALLLPKATSPDFDDLLSSAVISGRTNMVAMILKRGGNVNETDPKSGRHVLFRAVSAENLDMVTFLVEAGADVNLKDSKFWTPLDVAVEVGRVSVIEYLKEQGAMSGQ